MKTTYSILQVCEDVADELRQFRTDTTMIRTAINDAMDRRDKEGFRVRFNFNQDKAVRRVKKLIQQRRMS